MWTKSSNSSRIWESWTLERCCFYIILHFSSDFLHTFYDSQVIISSGSLFLTIYFLANFLHYSKKLKLFLQVKSFWQAEITSFFHFYLHICFIFVVRNWWNTSSNLYKHFKFCFCLGYINLHYSHSYWVIRDFCHMSYHCFTVFDSTALFILASLFLCSLVFSFPALSSPFILLYLGSCPHSPSFFFRERLRTSEAPVPAGMKASPFQKKHY